MQSTQRKNLIYLACEIKTGLPVAADTTVVGLEKQLKIPKGKLQYNIANDKPSEKYGIYIKKVKARASS